MYVCVIVPYPLSVRQPRTMLATTDKFVWVAEKLLPMQFPFLCIFIRTYGPPLFRVVTRIKTLLKDVARDCSAKNSRNKQDEKAGNDGMQKCVIITDVGTWSYYVIIIAWHHPLPLPFPWSFGTTIPTLSTFEKCFILVSFRFWKC